LSTFAEKCRFLGSLRHFIGLIWPRSISEIMREAFRQYMTNRDLAVVRSEGKKIAKRKKLKAENVERIVSRKKPVEEIPLQPQEYPPHTWGWPKNSNCVTCCLFLKRSNYP
jgi:hypothetical protein